MGRPSKYQEEFRRRAAAVVLDSGRSTHDVGRKLGVNHETRRRSGSRSACPSGWPDVPSDLDVVQAADKHQVGDLLDDLKGVENAV